MYKLGQFRYPAVQRYVQDLALEMGEHIDNVTSTLSMFIEVGIPAIRCVPSHNCLMLSDVLIVPDFPREIVQGTPSICQV